MSKKNKLKNIIEGWTSEDSTMSKERVEICLKCPILNTGTLATMMKTTLNLDTCGNCGCAVIEKARVEDEECPLKKWKMEITNKQGISLSLINPEYAELEMKNEQFFLKFKDVKYSENKIKFELNVRNNTNAVLSDLSSVPTCGCTTTSNLPKTLLEGEKTPFVVEYNMNKKGGKVEKTVFLKVMKGKEEILTIIKLEGNVKS